MKISEITYERNFELQRFVFEKIQVRVTIPETDTTSNEQLLEQVKQFVLDNSSLAKPLEAQLGTKSATRISKQNGKETKEEIEYL